MLWMDDVELVAAWRAGDKAAGRRLFECHFGTLHRFFANKVREDPEGLVGDTLLACLESLHLYEGRAPFRYYLLGIARNRLRRYWAEQGRRGPNEPIDGLSIAELGAGPSTIIGRDQDENRLLEALRRISLAEQEILELYYWEHLTGPELGELLGLTEAGARSRVHRAKQSLCEEYHRLERVAGVPESTEGLIDEWAAGVRKGLHEREPPDVPVRTSP
jgi:RNA polymerase sigma factor (sigma-70 family)